ncbi:hypothetical protein MPTK1_1g24580 [Marchantia polymorpha subsp. ruderalis]|uniref:Uncharacterized protein n=2 Tax=Marchantia polymorpha TaxID=3197 RepID=A0AAF6ATV7_MARPO|nr:hypothetical protein MARPO_0061s0064 [Marchantia polymorpha]BBM99877.1 hypothetical protein Mp_1g24580 [Marchantia polymorpha subsp. ruderalis]|eukprot:PTQ36808.1 hypothetical protein MARPO_0061s0064 [Marchantia polymorpha]
MITPCRTRLKVSREARYVLRLRWLTWPPSLVSCSSKSKVRSIYRYSEENRHEIRLLVMCVRIALSEQMLQFPRYLNPQMQSCGSPLRYPEIRCAPAHTSSIRVCAPKDSPTPLTPEIIPACAKVFATRPRDESIFSESLYK